jgi:flagellar hook-associated protein 3 FlgL
MTTLRVTQRLLSDRVLNNLRTGTNKLLDLNNQLSTGRRINAPSDDPVDVRRTINTRVIIQKNEQYVDNIAMTRPQHEATSTILTNLQGTIQRVHELTLQGANSANSVEQLSYIAQEINQLLEGILESANQQTNGRYIFSGTRTLTRAFEPTRDANGDIISVAYQGDGNSIELAVSDTAKVTITEPGDRVFNSSVDVFQMLINIRDDLRTGNVADLGNARLDELDATREQLSRALARVGAVQNRVDRTQFETEDFILSNEALVSHLVDIDLATLFVDLNLQQNAYQAALNASARLLQNSLLDFVR